MVDLAFFAGNFSMLVAFIDRKGCKAQRFGEKRDGNVANVKMLPIPVPIYNGFLADRTGEKGEEEAQAPNFSIFRFFD